MNLLPIISDSAWEIIDKYKKPKIISKPVTILYQLNAAFQ